jgi:hypothetical protein
MQKIAGTGAPGAKYSEGARNRQRTVNNNARSARKIATAPSR